MTHDDFMQEILANPDDDAPRLVYSDWLDEHGDSLQAEFIRAQCELDPLTLDDPRYEDVEKRERAVRLQYEPIWRTTLPEWTAYLRIQPRRGFGGRVYTSIPNFVRNATRLFKFAPIQHLDFGSGEPYLERLLLRSQLKQVRSLRIDYCDFTSESYHALANCPHLSGLVKLRLERQTKFDRAAAEILINSPHLRSLKTLLLPAVDPRVRELLSKRFPHFSGLP